MSRLLAKLPPQPDVQLIVTASDDNDESIPSAVDGRAIEASRPDVVWVQGPPGRGVQLNAGAARAEGRWLWFVHADSMLPRDFRPFLAGSMPLAPIPLPMPIRKPRPMPPTRSVVGGSFRFALDSAAWQARVWERGVALRVALFGLPYGDQGLFVRRDVFERMGGFRPIPLMEDVEFVGRMKREGRMVHLKVKVVTSARRWERDGWWRRSRRNLGLLALTMWA